MKKKIIAVALITGMTLTGVTLASANWGNKGMGQNNNGTYSCPCATQGASTQIDPAIQEKIDLFQTQNQDLKRSMVVKNAELRALMRGDNPDSSKVAKLTGELFDLKAELRTKAEAAGIEEYIAKGSNGKRGGRGNNGGGNGGGQKMMGNGSF